METLALGLFGILIGLFVSNLNVTRILKELREQNAKLAKQLEFMNYMASAHVFDDGAELKKKD